MFVQNYQMTPNKPQESQNFPNFDPSGKFLYYFECFEELNHPEFNNEPRAI